jgi:hypothetical protein
MLVAFSAITVVLLGLTRMLLSSQVASNTTHEATLARQAARRQIEIMSATPLADVYAAYNASTADDGTVAGATPGVDFAVEGLQAPLDDADGLPGRILFPEKDGVLSENVSAPQYGWPIDMDGLPGVTEDVSSTYRLLPVVVQVDWRGVGGNGTIEFRTLLGGI